MMSFKQFMEQQDKTVTVPKPGNIFAAGEKKSSIKPQESKKRLTVTNPKGSKFPVRAHPDSKSAKVARCRKLRSKSKGPGLAANRAKQTIERLKC